MKFVVLDILVCELKDVDIIVIGVLIYNFFVLVVLKVWIDFVVCVCEIFKYIENGLVGFLFGKWVIVVIVLGGMKVELEIDFVINYLKYVFGFIGIIDV